MPDLRTLPENEAHIIVRFHFYYNAEEGVLRWSNGEFAGYYETNSGYIRVDFNGVKYKAHKLIWLYMTGTWPKQDIDHIDRRKQNNKWNNLRDVSRSINVMNVGIKSNNTSGCTGVYKAKKGKWEARDQRGQTIGTFYTKEAAIEARLKSIK